MGELGCLGEVFEELFLSGLGFLLGESRGSGRDRGGKEKV